jgi:hypothetical protein
MRCILLNQKNVLVCGYGTNKFAIIIFLENALLVKDHWLFPAANIVIANAPMTVL